MAHVQVYWLHCDGSAIYIHQKVEAIGDLKQMVYSPQGPDVTSIKAAWELQSQKHLKTNVWKRTVASSPRFLAQPANLICFENCMAGY